MKKIFFLILISLVFFQLKAQQISLFVSKKKFQFSTEFYKPLSAWQAQTDSLGLTQESLQLASVAKLSEQWANFLKISKPQIKVHQIQLDTKKGPEFFQKYVGSHTDIQTLKQIFPNSEYLLCIDSVQLEARKIPNVYVVSNRMMSESRTIRAGKIYVSLWNLKHAKLLVSKSYDWEQQNQKYPQKPIHISEKTYLIDKMWSELFNMFYEDWNE